MHLGRAFREVYALERLYAIDLQKARRGGEVLREMRAAVGRAKRTAGGECRLSGIALDREGEKILFRFRLTGK